MEFGRHTILRGWRATLVRVRVPPSAPFFSNKKWGLRKITPLFSGPGPDPGIRKAPLIRDLIFSHFPFFLHRKRTRKFSIPILNPYLSVAISQHIYKDAVASSNLALSATHSVSSRARFHHSSFFPSSGNLEMGSIPMHFRKNI